MEIKFKLDTKKIPEPPLPLRPPTNSIMSLQAPSSPRLLLPTHLRCLSLLRFSMAPARPQQNPPEPSMTPDAITLHFKEAQDAFPPFEGKPTVNNLLLIREMPLPVLMEIPYD